MDANLTFNTIVFKKTFDEKDASERRSSTRGVNTPDMLNIKSQDYIDSVTKVAGRRFTCRVDRVDTDANGQSFTTSAYAVIAVPSLATQAQLSNVVTTFKAVVADANLLNDVVNNEK